MFTLKSMLVNVIIIASLVTPLAEAAYIVTNVPRPKQVIIVPRGYYCKIIPAHVYKKIWINTYKVCHAKNSHVKWVSAHWECTKYKTSNNTCRKWVWIPSYWTRK